MNEYEVIDRTLNYLGKVAVDIKDLEALRQRVQELEAEKHFWQDPLDEELQVLRKRVHELEAALRLCRDRLLEIKKLEPSVISHLNGLHIYEDNPIHVANAIIGQPPEEPHV